MDDTEDKLASQSTEMKTLTGLYGEENNSIKKSRSLKSLRRKKFLLVSFALLFIMIFSVGTLALVYTRDQQRILEGVKVSGVDVGNLTRDDAKKIIDKEVSSLLSQTIVLSVGQQSPKVKLEDLGLALNADLALQEAYDIGRKGSIFEKVASKWSAAKGVNIDFSQEWDESKIREALKGTLDEFNDPATDATFEITKDNIMTIKNDQKGLIVDSEELLLRIKEINLYKMIPELKAEFTEQLPLITAAQLEDQKITGLLASYTTRFDPAQTARTENVKIAAKALDMAVIKPGSTLSFNQIVGERTVEGGYKDAFVIVNGEFVPGLAGGICQVSSTLYNTGLFANLAVTQRSNHDLAISYVPLGQDATVAYPDLDLKFNNNTGGYLLVRTKMSYNSITIEMYGKVKPGQEVFIGNTIDSTIPAAERRVVDETMAHGASVLKQQGQPGYVVKSIRTVKLNGVVVSNEPLKQSRYLPLPKIYAIGP
ncbi:VanW family protein [Desulfosporosinus fructosivorans]|nr:VanW family protein [Desulfosporosinus fructosivorans]